MDKYADEFLEREFVGYGMNPPNPEWPGKAKVCVSFVMQYYMGAVRALSCSVPALFPVE